MSVMVATPASRGTRAEPPPPTKPCAEVVALAADQDGAGVGKAG